jgi:hypothetical protein
MQGVVDKLYCLDKGIHTLKACDVFQYPVISRYPMPRTLSAVKRMAPSQ